MNSAYSLSVVKQTALVLLPEIDLARERDRDDDGARPSIAQPRRFWCAMQRRLQCLLALVALLCSGSNAAPISTRPWP